MKHRSLSVFAASAIIALGACSTAPGSSGGAGRTVYIGIELPQQGSELAGAERAGRTIGQAIAAQRDEGLDIGDAGRSDPVLHAGGYSLTTSEALPDSTCRRDRGRPDRRARGPHGRTRVARL